MICPGQTIDQIINQYCYAEGVSLWEKRVYYMKPTHVLELGTGQGMSGHQIMTALLPTSKFTTINYDYPANQRFGEKLEVWNGDSRLTIITADTTDPMTIHKVRFRVDLLHIDTHHESWQAALELSIFQKCLENNAIVVCDDLNQNDMGDFWKSIPYEKEIAGSRGLFRYDAGKPYVNRFPRGKTPKELAAENKPAPPSTSYQAPPVMLTIIHLHTPGQGTGVACGTAMPATVSSLKQHNHQFSGEPRAVNCPACKGSASFKAAVEKLRDMGVVI